MLLKATQSQKYFKQNEFQETLTSVQYDKTKTQTRSYTYKCSGAVYEGQWKGGFRHGTGTMKWQDGASYEG